MPASSPDPPERDEFRWQAFFQHAGEPIFVLNRRRRLLFVNHAWEKCTGLRFAHVRGRVCRRRRQTSGMEKDEAILSTLAPPAEALEGRVCQARRRAVGSDSAWWQLDFFPLMGEEGPLGVFGRITLLPSHGEAALTLPEKLMALRDRQAAHFQLDTFVHELPSLKRLVEQARLAARSRLNVTIVGEAGTGKQWLARAIHYASEERQRYFACLDCAGLPAEALAEILSGPRSVRSSLGTLYLREPAGLRRDVQDGLAEAGPSDATPRLIAGFRADPAQDVKAGRLSEEFACALGTLTLTLPPLRDRMPDLEPLSATFLKRSAIVHETSARALSLEALAVLQAYAWPGNLRELYNVLRSASLRAKSGRIEPTDLPFYLRHRPLPVERKLPLDQLLEQAERRLIVLALRLADNNRAQAARLLDIWRPRLTRRMEHLGIDVPNSNDAPEA